MLPDESTSNPYLSPKVDSENLVRGDDSWLGPYRPVVMPQDAVDVFFGVTFGLLFAGVVYGVPFGVLFYFNAPGWSYLVTVVLIVVLAVVVMNMGIRQVDLTRDGIVATRPLLPLLRISWSEVETVRVAGRASVLLATVFLPHRCCSYSFTYCNQVEITAGRIRILFPPQDYGTFAVTVRNMSSQHKAPEAE